MYDLHSALRYFKELYFYFLNQYFLLYLFNVFYVSYVTCKLILAGSYICMVCICAYVTLINKYIYMSRNEQTNGLCMTFGSVGIMNT